MRVFFKRLNAISEILIKNAPEEIGSALFTETDYTATYFVTLRI